MRTALVFFLCLLAVLAGPPQANDKENRQQQLTELKNRIEKLRKTIEAKENSRSSYHRQLRTIEKQIGSLSRKISESNQAITSKKQDLRRLQTGATMPIG